MEKNTASLWTFSPQRSLEAEGAPYKGSTHHIMIIMIMINIFIYICVGVYASHYLLKEGCVILKVVYIRKLLSYSYNKSFDG